MEISVHDASTGALKVREIDTVASARQKTRPSAIAVELRPSTPPAHFGIQSFPLNAERNPLVSESMCLVMSQHYPQFPKTHFRRRCNIDRSGRTPSNPPPSLR
ncbi:hypothetical protein N7541_004470 [Penicillium brevicompactum]|uniref:Uncharacterized protein n=1 Tax=Penicillium brevicompactum TaxID=5074 RepID=A0A9W9UU02_PENBR|nr:hypothetical protein N7541_004470 [Penicillium brevicompactum]